MIVEFNSKNVGYLEYHDQFWFNLLDIGATYGPHYNIAIDLQTLNGKYITVTDAGSDSYWISLTTWLRFATADEANWILENIAKKLILDAKATS